MAPAATELEDGTLLQERLAGFNPERRPWRIIITTLLLKQTRVAVAEEVASEIFRLWPTPEGLAISGKRLETVCRPAGLWKRRAADIRAVSREYADWAEDWDPEPAEGVNVPGPAPDLVRSWPGCGQYVEDAVRLLVWDDLSGPPPSDPKLQAWARSRASN